MSILTITPSAKEKIQEILTQQAKPFLRIAIQGGGCSGFSYVFRAENFKEDDDEVFGSVIIDPMSKVYLVGATVDCQIVNMCPNLIIDNPNAQTQCGCGSSFGV
jgi:iron-sulfur cluster insertion protein